MALNGSRLAVYRLTPDADAETLPVLEMRSGEGAQRRAAAIPNVEAVSFLLVPKRKAAAFSCSGARIEKLGLAASLAARLRLSGTKAKYVLAFPDCRLLIDGPRQSRRMFAAAAALLRRLGTPLGSEALQRRPELVLGWGPDGVALPPRAEPPRESAAKVAIVLHLFYRDLWPEFRAVLKSLPLAFDLFVSVTADEPELIAAIRADFADADIRVVENRGRDVRPFLLLLEQGALDGYDCVCKIHSKRTLHGLQRNPYGDVWRRRLLFDLLCADQAMARVVERFAREPALGLLGSEVFHMPGETIAPSFWRETAGLAFSLAPGLEERLGGSPPDHFSGTMFWVRPKALAALKGVGLSARFEAERAKTGGTLEHALEMAFPSVVRLAGYDVAEINGLCP